MAKQIGTKEITVNGQTVTVRVFSAKQQYREKIDRARKSGSFEIEAESRAEAAYQGMDLGFGYSAR